MRVLGKLTNSSRKKLNHEAYYADVHKMSFHGGKMWIAPPQLIREEVRSFMVFEKRGVSDGSSGIRFK
jgi:hypothetical protein